MPNYFPFPNTHWSLVRRAGIAQGDARREALTVLLERYQPALRSYLEIVRGLPESDVDDVLQSFLADKLLEQRFLRHADEHRGRFRTFLLTSLNHYVTSWHRSNKVRATVPLDGPIEPGDESAPTPAAIVEATWARTLVMNVLHVMEEECGKSGRQNVWAVFEGRLVKTLFDGCDPVPYQTLAAQLKLKSPTQAANLLVTGKRTYVRLLHGAVGEYEDGEKNIEEEIADLLEILQRGFTSRMNGGNRTETE
jgi:RNA polymerase sigma-70 factor (ECF subfamily)